MNPLMAPHLTEKSLRLADSGQYVFLVRPTASKRAIADAVTAHFGVQVESVTITRLPTKQFRLRGKKAPRRMTNGPIRKKAVVHLKSGQKLDLFAGIGE